MHPLPRMLQQRLIRLIARFANYMMNLKEGAALVSTPADPTTAVLDTELAKTVLGDIIVGQRQKTQEWNNMLQGLANKLGSEWTGEQSTSEAVITMSCLAYSVPRCRQYHQRSRVLNNSDVAS